MDLRACAAFAADILRGSPTAYEALGVDPRAAIETIRECFEARRGRWGADLAEHAQAQEVLELLDAIGLRALFAPWLGQEGAALTTLALVSVWQFVGIPMMLIYAALLSIPDEVIEAAEIDGVTGAKQFFKIQLPLILPTIGIISILTFVGNFNAFDLIYVSQGAQAGPNYSTDILGTLLYRTFFGFQLQLGDPNMGSTIATMMFLIILVGVSIYLFGIQTRLRRYQF